MVFLVIMFYFLLNYDKCYIIFKILKMYLINLWFYLYVKGIREFLYKYVRRCIVES